MTLLSPHTMAEHDGKCMLQTVREALPLFSEGSTQEINEKSSNANRVLVRATPKNKEEVKRWLEEFAQIAGISYISSKSFNDPQRRSYRQEFVCHHSNKNKAVKSSDARLVIHKHKATGCNQALYVR